MSRHGTLESLGSYMYMLGGYYGSCHSAHYRITSTGSSWEGRAVYPRPIHRHLMVVDRVKQRLYVFGGNSSIVHSPSPSSP